MRTQKYTKEDLIKAVEACHSANPHRITLQKGEELFGVPKATIADHLKGKASRREGHEKQQLLTHAEERALALYCKNRGWRGEAVGQDELRNLAGQICGKTPARKWVHAFAGRNPGIGWKWAQQGEAKRGNGLSKANVESFFKELKIASEGVNYEDIWNVDEKGFQANGGVLRQRVLVADEQKEPKIMGDESRKMVTILECTSATGSLISPLVIHEGAEKDGEWVRCNPCNAQ